MLLELMHQSKYKWRDNPGDTGRIDGLVGCLVWGHVESWDIKVLG